MWGQKWGSMVWGGVHTVPALSTGMLIALAVLLLVIGYRMGRQRRAPRWLALVVGVGAALLPVAVVQATTFTVPFTFTNGSIADANQVNQNFSTVATEIDRLRKQTAVLGDCAFHPRISSVQWQCALGQGGASITNGGDITLSGPVDVPQGATITSIDAWVADTSATVDVQLCMRGVVDNQGFFDGGPACVSTSGTPGFTKLTLNANVLQGNGEAWELFFFTTDSTTGAFVNWPAGATITVRTAYIHYETP
jgi:hypothetical protein